jgi:hypothetical protein
MTDTLLFLHLLSAACLFTAIFAYSAVALGAQLDKGPAKAFLALWHVGLVGVFLFGIALAIDIDGYELWDAWVLIAIGLWLAAGYAGDKLGIAFGKDGVSGVTAELVRFHWISVLLVVLLLADMVWKPWA